MNLEIIIANEVIERQVSYDITYMWNLKYNTDELIWKIDLENKCMATKGKRWEGGIN